MIVQSNHQKSSLSQTESEVLLQWITKVIIKLCIVNLSLMTEEWFVLRKYTFHITWNLSRILVTHDVTNTQVFQVSPSHTWNLAPEFKSFILIEMRGIFVLLHQLLRCWFCFVSLEFHLTWTDKGVKDIVSITQYQFTTARPTYYHSPHQNTQMDTQPTTQDILCTSSRKIGLALCSYTCTRRLFILTDTVKLFLTKQLILITLIFVSLNSCKTFFNLEIHSLLVSSSVSYCPA
jgi:hypothetical protein